MKTTSNSLTIVATEHAGETKRHRIIRITGSSGRDQFPDIKASQFLTGAGFVAEGGRNADLAFKGAKPLGNDFFLDLAITPGTRKDGHFQLIRVQNGSEMVIDAGTMYDLDRTNNTMIVSGSTDHLAETQIVIGLLPVGEEKKPDPPPLPPPPAPPPDPDQLNPTQAGQDEVEIPLDKIEPWPGQPRKYFREKPLFELAGSIKGLYQLEAIMIRPFHEGEARLNQNSTHQIVDGQRRYLAALLVEGKKTIRARIAHPKNMVEQHRMSVIANLHREKHSHYELASAVIFQYDNGRTVSQIAADFSNQSCAWVYRYLELKALVPELFELLSLAVDRKKRLSFGIARLLASVKAGAQLTIWEKAQQEGAAHGPRGVLLRLQELAADNLSETALSGRKRSRGAEHVMRPVNRAIATIGYNARLLADMAPRFKKRSADTNMAARAEIASQARAMAEKLLAFSQAIMD